jgi:hypothetical protein
MPSTIGFDSTAAVCGGYQQVHDVSFSGLFAGLEV